MKKFTATLLTIMLVFGTVGTTMAYTQQDVQYVFDQVNLLINAGKMSNNEVYGIYIDLTNVPNGSIASTVYQTDAQLITPIIANVSPQTIYGANGARDKITRFFWHIRNSQTDTDNIMVEQGGPQESITQFVYGPQKIDIINTYIAGIPTCLANDRIVYDTGGGSGFGSTTTTTETTTNNTNPNAWADAYLSTIFSVGSTSVTSTFGTETNTNETTTTMDVAPYIKGDRTYVPVAHLAFSLGVSNDGVTWNGDTQQVGITKGDTSITLLIGSPVMLVNQSPVRMDVSPEITNNRTFLPAGWVAEALGAEVSWNAQTNQIVIKTPIAAPGS